MSKQKMKRNLGKLFLELALFLLSLVIIVPLLIMLFGAFKNSTEVTAFDLALPEKWLFENFLVVF